MTNADQCCVGKTEESGFHCSRFNLSVGLFSWPLSRIAEIHPAETLSLFLSPDWISPDQRVASGFYTS